MPTAHGHDPSGRDASRLLHLLGRMPVIAWATDLDLRFTWSTGGALNGLGLEPDEIVGSTLQEYFGTDDSAYPPIAAHLQALDGTTSDFDVDWGGRTFQVHVEPLMDADDRTEGAMGVALDITDRSEVETRLRQAEERYRSLVEQVPAVVYTAHFGADGAWEYVSPQIESILGYTPEEWMADPELWAKRIHPADRERELEKDAWSRATGAPLTTEYRMLDKHGRMVWVRDEAIVVRDAAGQPLFFHGVLIDISDRKELEAQLRHQALHDPLTNLANRVLFGDRVEHALARSDRSHDPLAVLFLDLDDFKTINDSLGHVAGDQLLISVALRLRECLRPSDTVARLGGDEFAILLEDMREDGDADVVANRIMETLAKPFRVQDKEMFVQASIGIAVSTRAEGDTDKLLRNADVAMYMAKDRGKGRHEKFEPSMHAVVLERLELKADIQRALSNEEFVCHYQPIASLDTGRIAAVEALVRWHHSTRGLLLPAEFLPMAEESGLILALDRWVLDHACRQVKVWQEHFPGDPPLAVSVNLSATQFSHPGLIEQLVDVLNATGLDPTCLILEITESVLMGAASATVGRLTELKKLGVRLAIDDFGTGYSSLSYLQHFPIDIIKIDKSFVDGVGRGPEESALAHAIVKLGHTFRLETIAEGIELAHQPAELRALGCHLGQGYHFARPMGHEGITELLGSSNYLSGSAFDALVAPRPGPGSPGSPA